MTPEEKARKLIDARLEQSGWVVQDLRNVNPMASLGVAVREYHKHRAVIDCSRSVFSFYQPKQVKS